MKRNTIFIALGGVMCALAVAVMFLGSIVPFATFAVPALASMCVLYMVLEFGMGAGFLAYAAISVLSVLLAPDKEAALIFIFFFGHYPLLKAIFEKHLSRAVAWICKFVSFNACVLLMYWLALKAFLMPAIQQEFEDFSTPYALALLALGNVVLVIFDIALTRLISSYLNRWREKLIKRI